MPVHILDRLIVYIVIAVMENKIIPAVITFQICKIFFLAVIWCLISLQNMYQTGFAGWYLLTVGFHL